MLRAKRPPHAGGDCERLPQIMAEIMGKFIIFAQYAQAYLRYKVEYGLLAKQRCGEPAKREVSQEEG